jgi:hypothetical protein
MSDIVTDNPIGAANDIVMAKQMAEALHAAYPGHMWAVACDGQIGFADVRNLALSGNWGFRIKLDEIYSGSNFKHRVLMAGGELLERYRLNRGKFNQDQYQGLQTDFAGRFKADL